MGKELKDCNEECALFRRNECETERSDGKCDRHSGPVLGSYE